MAIEDLRKNHMMSHLLDALDEGQDIGHYGRLVFAIVGRHFMNEDELVGKLANDHDFGQDEARDLVKQVEQHDYNPPRREKILEYMQKQDFPILPNVDDPDEGNVYRDLDFPESVYDHIQQYRHQKDD
ncbi:hypothetical protein [Deinococcus yavapaiensis]|uniref:Uncharacterized protein n=1 Tax=Deinococcus yavapaiensis KR-236 TaxID=694435 RepID=A0A318SEW2_9DEIO|nr:hypothetical protein [Deinococcus yavapaiensis]PYE51879.1 hypothetical protein DES52_11480 [Deinococcus yavapaiensis KR-236]